MTAGDEYVPTTDEVRYGYQMFYEEDGAAFDRWLAAHDAEVAARALREAAEVIDGAEIYDELAAPNLDGVRWTEECVHGAVAESGPITDWLRNRADRIERQEVTP